MTFITRVATLGVKWLVYQLEITFTVNWDVKKPYNKKNIKNEEFKNIFNSGILFLIIKYIFKRIKHFFINLRGRFFIHFTIYLTPSFKLPTILA